jgi:hypothetical protein
LGKESTPENQSEPFKAGFSGHALETIPVNYPFAKDKWVVHFPPPEPSLITSEVVMSLCFTIIYVKNSFKFYQNFMIV